MWNEIREATGTKLGSGAFQKHWEREGIDHLPSHADSFKRAKGEREGRARKPDEKPATEPAEKPKARRRTAPKTSGAAETKPASARRSKS